MQPSKILQYKSINKLFFKDKPKAHKSEFLSE